MKTILLKLILQVWYITAFPKYHNACHLDGIIKMSSQYIRLSYTVREQAEIKRQCAATPGFPNVIGAIDCTHIAIRAPYGNESVYINRKHVHTIKMQVMWLYNDFN